MPENRMKIQRQIGSFIREINLHVFTKNGTKRFALNRTGHLIAFIEP